MARLYVMVGVPGSGKTTYAREHLVHAIRVSLDDLRLMMTGRSYDKRYEPVVVAAGHALLESLLARAKARRLDVLLDATNGTRQVRKRYIKMARQYGVAPVAVFIDCDLATSLARDAGRPQPVGLAVVQSFHERLQPPTEAEGFDEVVHVTQCTS